jgi:RNA polymerase sigma-54 factor
MELKQQLRVVQDMRLVMTPQLQQAIKLLQLSRLELVETVRQEIEENPILEEVAEVPSNLHEADKITKFDDVPGSSEEAVPITAQEVNWQDLADDAREMPSSVVNRETNKFTYESFLSKATSLADHLMWQFRLATTVCEEVDIGEEIIGNIDDDGYLRATSGEIAAAANKPEELVEKVLKKIQDFDPPGVAARDLKECLMNQARLLGVADSTVGRIIAGHLEDLENKRHAEIAAALAVPAEEVAEAVKVISHMEPKPGRPFWGADETRYITPDITVHKVGNDYQIIMNEDGLPKLRISNFYRKMAKARDMSHPEAREYIQDKMKSAIWLIKSIQQRQRTIYKTVESLVKFQRDFLDNGVKGLKPLILRDVAEDIGMHESTISRVTTNKYVHTPQGIFELKYFFNTGIQCDDGKFIASANVKEKIKAITDSEGPEKPVSDQEISDRLKSQGIIIARRTVTKYREMMNILPSSGRRRKV